MLANNSLQATAGAVAFELWPHPRIVWIQSGRHEGNNMSGKYSHYSATMLSKYWGAALASWPIPDGS